MRRGGDSARRRRRRARRRRTEQSDATNHHSASQPTDGSGDADAKGEYDPADAAELRPRYLFAKGLVITTWNTRALLTPDPDMHFRRWRCVMRLAARSQVVCLQEVHSDEATMHDAATRLAPTHFATVSACAQHDAGGVMTLVSHELADAASAHTEVILRGRMTVTSVRTRHGQLVHFANIHNHEVPPWAISALRARLRRAAEASPPEYVFLAGDWNFPSDTGRACTTTDENGNTTTSRATYNSGAWRTTLNATTEVGHELPTRAASTTLTDGTKATTLSSLDRLYTTLPPTILAEVAATVEVGMVRGALQEADRAPLSDHVYVRTTLRLRPELPPQVRPIPPWITRHDIYKREVRRRLDDVHLESLHPHDALRRTKQAIRSAAATTRARCLRRRPTTPREYTMLGLQLARALARNDMAMTRKVAQTWPAALATIETIDGVTRVTDLAALTKLIGTAIADPTTLATPAGGTTTPADRRRNATRYDERSAKRRWVRLWVPHMQRQ